MALSSNQLRIYFGSAQHYVSEVILEKLTTSSASTLRIMEMVVDADNIFLEQTVSSDAWSAVVERCPLLKVTVRFVGLCTYRKYAAILQRNMPLSAVSLFYKGRNLFLLTCKACSLTLYKHVHAQTHIRTYNTQRPTHITHMLLHTRNIHSHTFLCVIGTLFAGR